MTALPIWGLGPIRLDGACNPSNTSTWTSSIAVTLYSPSDNYRFSPYNYVVTVRPLQGAVVIGERLYHSSLVLSSEKGRKEKSLIKSGLYLQGHPLFHDATPQTKSEQENREGGEEKREQTRRTEEEREGTKERGEQRVRLRGKGR